VCFVDEQEAGPYAQWRHTHRFEPRGHATVMHDTVEYREPFGPIGQLAHALFVRRMLDRIFDFRRDATNLLLARSRAAASASGAMRTRAAKGACA
jgi:ligand-binding SRPBCC domain-containing protein